MDDRSKAEEFRTICDLATELRKLNYSPEVNEMLDLIISLACRRPDGNATDERPPVDDGVDHLGAMMDSDDPDVWPRLN